MLQILQLHVDFSDFDFSKKNWLEPFEITCEIINEINYLHFWDTNVKNILMTILILNWKLPGFNTKHLSV